MNDTPICNDVVTILPTQLITVSKEDIRSLSNEEQQMLKNNTEMMRSNEEVMFIYLENLYWKQYKRVVVDNVIRDKAVRKADKQADELNYRHTEDFVDFMMKNGCYVFSGSGLRFPEKIEDVPNPFDIKNPKPVIAFGATTKPTKAVTSIVDAAKQKAMAKLGKKV